jgi:hypothetical protein
MIVMARRRALADKTSHSSATRDHKEELMQRRLHAAIFAFALIEGLLAGHAGAQTRDDNGASQGAQGQLDLSQRDAQSITNSLHEEQAQSGQPGYQGELGTKPPNSMTTQQLPDHVTGQVPKVKGYYFIKLPDRVLLLDPASKTVVEIVPAVATTGAGASDENSSNNPGSNAGSNSGNKQ